LAVLAQVADMERARIVERTAAGRALARDAMLATGKTHRGKPTLGRPLGRVRHRTIVPEQVNAWKAANGASISKTAEHWGISEATVKRYSRIASGSAT
jgi:putative DNA-invertase from lambdoid prophage Rac